MSSGRSNISCTSGLNQPLVVTDDDVAGTFTFIRALEDYGISPDLSAEEIGKAWLNYIVEERSILWWGGNGNSTEHTAWLNLKRGVAAPASGSIETNGSTVAEQIGAQIFIDGWAMVAPRQPELAARLAEQAGKVSHDGESVYAAMLWAAMEAEAFGSSDIDHLLDTGLKQIPRDSLIAKLIADIRAWHKANPDWRDTRKRIEEKYGYDKYPGNCHVVPNHALMVMSVLYAPHDFQKAQMIVNTSGWDTDCNAGNVGCLLGIMNGLDGLDEGPDWRGPIADRLLISSADGGNSINDAVRTAYYLTNIGLQLAGSHQMQAPKEGAQFHFSLPGSRQGFRPQIGLGLAKAVSVGNAEFEGSRALAISYEALGPGQVAAVTSPTFSPREMLNMRTYDLMATPLVYPGQVVKARVAAPAGNKSPVEVRLRVRVYDERDELRDVDGAAVTLKPGDETELEWRLPEFVGPADRRDRAGDIGHGKTRRRHAAGRLSALGRRAQPHAAPARAGMRFLAHGLGEWRQHLVKTLSAELPHLAGARRRHHLARHAPVDRLRGEVRHRLPSRQLRGRRAARTGPAPLLRREGDTGRLAADRAGARRRNQSTGRNQPARKLREEAVVRGTRARQRHLRHGRWHLAQRRGR